MFIDRARIKTTGGAGGNGCCSFRREAHVPFGGPNGGDGGNGGDLIIVASSRLSSLLDMRYHSHWVGNRGQHGMGSDRHGKNGIPKEIQVPCGTLVRDFETGEILADLTKEEQTFCAAAGGKGGKGNARFTTSTNRAPKFAEKGEPGEEREYLLELKLIAEIGMVGLPNAGKSTLLSSISMAEPKIANYPFTTLTPNLGVVELSGFRTMTVADIPGIIEGASEGKGLGLDFLRHIERTKVLLYLIDAGDPNPGETLNVLEAELRQYSVDLPERLHCYVFNKMDITENQDHKETLSSQFPNALFISAVTGFGIQELLEALWILVEEARRLEAADEQDITVSERTYTYESPFTVNATSDGYEIIGKRVVRAVRMTDFENPEAVRHLEDVLGKMGVFRALKRIGAESGTTIHIDDIELEYQPDKL